MNDVLDIGLGKDELWVQSPDRIQTHYSAIGAHRQCAQKWYFRYGLGLGRPLVGPAPYLYYGSWFGAMRTAEALVRGREAGSLIGRLDKRFQPIDRGDPDKVPTFDMNTVTPREVLLAAVEWYKARCAEDPEEQAKWHEDLGDDLPRRLRDGFTRWKDEWGAQSRKEAPLALEMFWKRKLPRPADDEAWDPIAGQMPEIYLIGFIDELYLDLERDIVVVRDNKTTSRMPSGSTSLTDMMDSQLQLYPWGVTPMLHDLGIKPPRAISYDRAFSKKPTLPRLNLNGTLSAATKLYDLRTYQEWAREDTRPKSIEELQRVAIENTSTKTKTTSWDMWPEEQQQIMLNLLRPENAGRVYGNIGQFSAKGDPKFGIYREEPEVVVKLSSTDWRTQFHQRTLTPVNRQVIQAHLRAAVDTTTDIWRTQVRAQTQYDAARNLTASNCQWCDYAALCRAQMFGGADGVYDIREFGLRHKDGHILEKGEVRDVE